VSDPSNSLEDTALRGIFLSLSRIPGATSLTTSSRSMLSRCRVRAGLLLLGVICVIIGCRGSEPERASEQTVADTTSWEGAVVDSSGQDTTGAESDSVRRPGPVPPGPAPGTVRVRAVVASCDTTSNPTHCQLRIEEVLAYGSSTPPIGTGERSVHFSEGLLSERAVDDLTATSHVYVLHHVGDRPRVRKGGGERRVEWTARSIDPK
jgi:hypothetical protein